MFYILGIILWVIFAFLPAIVARRKGYSFILFFLLSLVLFIFSLVAVLALPDRTRTAEDIAAEKAANKALAKEENKAKNKSKRKK